MKYTPLIAIIASCTPAAYVAPAQPIPLIQIISQHEPPRPSFDEAIEQCFVDAASVISPVLPGRNSYHPRLLTAKGKAGMYDICEEQLRNAAGPNDWPELEAHLDGIQQGINNYTVQTITTGETPDKIAEDLRKICSYGNECAFPLYPLLPFIKTDAMKSRLLYMDFFAAKSLNGMGKNTAIQQTLKDSLCSRKYKTSLGSAADILTVKRRKILKCQ